MNCSTPWNHLFVAAGHCVGPAIKHVHPKNLQGDALEEFYTAIRPMVTTPARDTPYAEWIAKARRSYGYCNTKKRAQLFKNFHVGRPYVGTARVARNDHWDLHKGVKHQGIGRHLYYGAALALSKMGLTLDGSDCQTEDAKATWAFFARTGCATHHLVNGKDTWRLHPARIADPTHVPVLSSNLRKWPKNHRDAAMKGVFSSYV